MTIFTGKTEEAAITAGLTALNSTRDQVTIQVVTEARRGVFGLGRRDAAVDVVLIPVSQPAERPTEAAVATANRPVSAAPVSETATAVAETTPVAVAPTVAAPSTAESRAHRQAAIEAVADYVLDIVTQLGIDATVEVEQPGHRQVRLAFTTEKEGLLIGKHGRTINALQSLAQLFLNHHGAAHVAVELDVANYRERRQTTLARLADNTAREVVASGKPIYLDPMPSFERKQIHAALAQNKYVTTYSAGKEPHRAVVIEPA